MKFLLLGMAMFVSSTVQAGFVHTDWKTSGDQRATLHEETGIEWLKVDNTTGLSVNQVLGQTGVGGDYEGWRLPTSNEMDNWWRSIFAGSTILNYAQGGRYNFSNYSARMTDWFAYNGTQTGAPTTRSYGIGLGLDGDYSFFGVSRVTSQSAYRYAAYTYTGDYTNSYMGVFLVSDGGTTITSINNPYLNINNSAAPINNVSAPILGFLSLLMFMLGFRRGSV